MWRRKIDRTIRAAVDRNSDGQFWRTQTKAVHREDSFQKIEPRRRAERLLVRGSQVADCGYLTSLDIGVLKKVFDETCAKNDTAPDSPAASHFAKALMAAFENGIQDKAGLLAILGNKDRWAA
ncbi:hypothetical protein [Allomesorhizobium alhagi]|uniref:Uncharacterized protein n=1 Tax=Mesorhizobium alhagi CCNWXJ12-2 TaxID=1107882 RepID=H0I0N3_9HYPH|nr:hypothetical protein [Mesorhizobium alhagi]EHK53458.1 hypothetical protein MAXJ12_30102 [Mesorhizobium alhagi CCNWXJ12-2]